MGKIIYFPVQIKRTEGLAEPKKTIPKEKTKTSVKNTFVNGIWVLLVLIWPILKWVIAIDCVIQLGRALFGWDSNGIAAVFPFITHFTSFVALTYFVTIFKPKNLT